MSEPVEIRHGTVLVGSDCYECGGPIECSPEEARALAARILDAADRADANLATIAAACADGHDWGAALNMWANWADKTKVAVEYCRREGCDGRRELPGWVEFAGRLHFDPFGRQVSCYGPGCEQCEDERFGKAIRAVMADVVGRIDREMGAAS